VLTATNKNLEDLIREKKFREDLYYRINVINLTLPPLRDRFEDIAPLIEHFSTRFSPVYGGKKLTFTQDALDILVQYDWPGNVRELENVVESLMALAPREEVTAEDLPRKVKTPGAFGTLKSNADSGISFTEAERLFESDMIVKALRKTNYVQTKAAELLGISRRILKYKMDKLGITEEGGLALSAQKE
jgi:DNA-binding NtrC family response regulator